MFRLDSTQITAVIAIAAIISPILTAIINNAFHLIEKSMDNKEKKRERTTDYKRKIIENYLSCLGRQLAGPSYESTEHYKEVYTLVLLYVPSDIRNIIIKIDNCIFDHRDHAKKLAEDLIPILKQYLTEL